MPLLPVRSLASKHAWVWSGLVGLLLAGSGLMAAAFAWRDTVQGVKAVQHEQAIAVAERIGNFFERIEQPLRWIVDDPTRGDDVAPHALRIELVQMLRRQPALAELRWIDRYGRESLALSRLAMDVADGARDWSVDPLVLGARRHGVQLGAVTFLRGSEPHVVLALANRSDGPVLLAEVNLKAVWEIVHNLPQAAGGVAYVVDAKGQLIAHPERSLVLRRTDMAGMAHVRAALAGDLATTVHDANGLDGTPVFAAAAPLPRLGWMVFIERSRRDALAPVWRALERSAMLTGLGVVLAIAASAWLARRLVQPITALQARAADIAAGRLDQRIELDSGDELQALGEQFNRMAEDLQGIYASLEARVTERTLALTEANEAKRRFLAAASHDLRQPVHALGLFAGQLRQASNPAHQRTLVAQIERSVEAFETLLQALLDISRLDAGTVEAHREAVELGPLLERLAAGFAPDAAARGLRLRVRPSALWVDSDPMLLERVLLNLIGNALRYTSRGGVLVGTRRRGAQIEIIVADTGIGIAPEQQALVFQEFYRAPGTSPSGEVGLGLGLAIVRRLLILLDHDMALHSVPGHGSCFRLTLRPAPALEPGKLVARTAEPLAGRRVLVVDDDPAIVEATRGQLVQWGCVVDLASSTTQALDLWRAVPADLVLTDLHLADGETGLDLARQLRAAGAGPIVVITADTAPERLQPILAAGFQVLSKPLRPARLRALLEALLPPRLPS